MSDESQEHRAAVVAEWRERRVMHTDKPETQKTKIEEMDLRHISIGDPRREVISNAINAKIARLTGASKTTPLRLSNLALKSLGLAPVTEAAE